MNRFNSHKDKRDKFMSMNVIIIYDMTTQEAIDALYAKLEDLKKIKDTYKRSYINNRIFSLITEFKTNRKITDRINEVVLLGQTIDSFCLTEEELINLRDFKVSKFTIQHGEYFDLDFLQDILYNIDYDEVIRINNNKLTHYHQTITKQKIVGTLDEKAMDVVKYVNENTTKPAVIHGLSSALKNLKLDKHSVFGRELIDEQLQLELTKLRMKSNLEHLRNVFEMFANPAYQHRILVGKEIRQGIQNQIVEKVIAVPEIAKKIKEKYADLINFQLIEVVLFDNNSDVMRLQSDFGGVIGVKYY